MKRDTTPAWVRSLLAALLIMSQASNASPSAVEPADIIFRGRAILTLDTANPRADTVAVRAGRIVFVGNVRGVADFVGEATRVIDLGNRMLMPAFHDSHMHPMSGGMRLLRCALDDVATAQGVVDALAACARRWPSSAWLIVSGLSETLAHVVLLDRHALDRIVPDRPLAIGIGAGFSLRVNSRALELAGFDRTGLDATHSDVERDHTTGEATGYVTGDAMQAVRHLWPRPSSSEYRQALHEASAMANRVGIVSILDASVDPEMLDAYRAADSAGELSVRVVAAQRIDAESGIAQIAAMRAARDAIHSKRLRADAAKIFVDGEIELHSAALLAPYIDAPGQRGATLLDTALLNELVARLDRDGFDVHMHVMGDRAVRAGLDAIASAMAANGMRDRRHELAHDEVIAPNDLPRFAALGVIANMQPAWAWNDPVNQDAERKLGSRRARLLVPMRSLLDAKARVVASSDWPAPTMNPLEGIQIAITHRPLDGSSASWHPAQRVSLMQMLKAYCVDAAWALRLEHESGSITVGKSADLIVLERDLRHVDPMALHNVRVLLTLLEGAAVYRDPAMDQVKP